MGVGFFSEGSESDMAKAPYTTNQKELVSLAYKRSQDLIHAQQQIANAADQRSLVFASLSVASAALVFSALSKTSSAGFGAGAAIFFLAAALATALTAMPQRFFSAGSKASDLKSNIDADDPKTQVLWGLCENNDEYISKNQNGAAVRATMFRLGVIFFIVGVILTFVGVSSAEISELGR